ncbi:MAG: non-canonical purine NTP diphosphatase [Bacteroidia bacterium]
MKLIFATQNQHKLQEMKLLLPKSIELVSLADMNFTDDIPETGTTLKENALLKARHIYEKFNLNCFSDDSGLEVEALNGAPGVYSARYAGAQKSEADNNRKILAELKDKPNRNARFTTVIALIVNGKEYTFDGIVEGAIVPELKGTQGFCYDPLFKPNRYDITFAEMSMTEKNIISHRAMAVNKLVDFLLANAQ